MRKLPKMIAVLMALAMLLTLGTAFAEAAEPAAQKADRPTKAVSIPVKFDFIGTPPAEAEAYGIRLEAKNGAPLPAGAADGVWTSSETVFPTGQLTADFVYDNVGIYEYKLSQTHPTPGSAGMTYDDSTYDLKITIYRENEELQVGIVYYDVNGKRSKANVVFTNERNTGSLKITKSIEVPDDSFTPDPSAAFSFSVKMSQAVVGAVLTGDAQIATTDNQTFTFSLKHGQSVTLSNLPIGAEYTVEELNLSRYYEKDSTPVMRNQDGSTAHAASGIISADNTAGETVQPGSTVSFVNVYNVNPETVVLSARKELTGRAWMADESYTFTLTPVLGAPMPEKAEDAVRTVTGANSAFSFGAIKYTKPGTYQYQIKETVPETNPQNGVTYDSHILKVEVTVVDNLDGTLTATADYGAAGQATFVNAYHAAATATIDAVKMLQGRDYQEGDSWTFSLSTRPSDAPVPAVKEVTITPTEGTEEAFTFGPIAYTEADIGKTYTYTITESGEVTAVTNAIHSDVTVTVQDNQDGTLNVQVAYPDPDTNARFTNTYRSSGNTSFDARKTLNGQTLTEGMYTFQLKDAAGTVLQEKSNTADGDIVFDAISYNQDTMVDAEGKNVLTKEIQYTVSEVVPEDLDENNMKDFYLYDTEAKPITVTLTDDGAGHITAAVTGNNPEFINAYETLNLSKALTRVVRGGAEIAVTNGMTVQQGDQLTYTITVNNVGGVTIPAGTAFTDTFTRTLKDNTTVVTNPPVTLTNPLAPGASVGLTYTYTVAENDKRVNNAVTSNIPHGDDPPPVVNPILSKQLTKTLTTITRGGAVVANHENAQTGDVVTYTVTLRNDGDVTIPAGQTVTDTMTRTLKDNTTATVVTPLVTTRALASGQSEALTYTYTVAPNDKHLTNVATSDLPGGENPPPVDTPISSLNVVKTTTSTPANGTTYALGETITYSIVVTNDGDTVITNIAVTDELTGGAWTIASLAAGASESFTTSYVVTEADIFAGTVLNEVTARGTDPNGDPVEDDDDEEDPTDDPKGHLTVVKTTTSTPANGTGYVLGETVSYEITVTNDGNVTVTDIVLTDERTGLEETVGTLKPGETSAVFKTSTTVTEKDILSGHILNDATATGKTPDPEDPDNPDSPNKPDVPVTPGHTEDPVIETVDLTVQKVWVETTTPARPANLIVTLTGNGTSQYVTLNEANAWTATVTGLPRYTAAGAEITYTWTEPTIAGYEQTNYVTTGNTTVITNTQTQVEAETEYTLTVRYRFLNGRQAAPDVTEQHVAGDPYNIVSPTIRGYTTTTLRVTGVMPESDLTRTVVYIPGNNTIVIDDFETPLGLGDVFINVGDCLE